MRSFQLGDFSINVSDEFERYNSIRIKYKKLAKNSKDDFINNFKNHFKNMDHLHNSASDVLKKYIDGAVSEAIQDSVSYKIFDINDNQFLKDYVTPNLTWNQDFDKIDDKYMAIILNAEEMERFRAARNEVRSGVVGGGFGLEGAAIGIGVAVVANTAFAIIRGLTDFAGIVISDIGDALKKDQLFNEPNTVNILADSLYRQVFCVHVALIQALATRNKIVNAICVFQEKENKALAIVDNISKDRIQAEDIQEAIVDGINNNPYNVKLYLYWLDRFGDAKKQLSMIAEFFGNDEVNDHKKTLMKNREEELSFSTTNLYEENITILESLAGYLGFNDFDAIKTRLEIKPRTFRGVLYPSEEARIEAQRSIEEKESRTVDGYTYENPEAAEIERNKLKLGFLYGLVILLSGWPAFIIIADNYTTNSRIYAVILAIPITVFSIFAFQGTGDGRVFIVFAIWGLFLQFIRRLLMAIAKLFKKNKQLENERVIKSEQDVIIAEVPTSETERTIMSDADNEKDLNKAATDRITSVEMTRFILLLIFGTVGLFAAWPVGIVFIIGAVFYYNTKLKKHKAQILAEGNARAESINSERESDLSKP